MISHDASTRIGGADFTHAGTGAPIARNCLPCGKNVMNQVGGGSYKYRGVRNVWHCAACKAKRADRMAGRAA